MQFVLTSEEFDALNERAAKGDEAPDTARLQSLCTLVANEVVLKDGWRKGYPWGCILTTDSEWYCDDCLARKLCPHPDKSWSK